MGACPMPGRGHHSDHGHTASMRELAMTETGTLEVAERADVIVRELRESDLPLADVILRSAFDTFTGVASLFGDRDYVRNPLAGRPRRRFRRRARRAAGGDEPDHELGKRGLLRPLSVRPELWG